MSTNILFNVLGGGPIRQLIAPVTQPTLDFPSISAASTATLTVAVPGARVGDIVLMALPATVSAGVVYDARVSASDVVTVRAINITASPVDPAAGLFDIVVAQL